MFLRFFEDISRNYYIILASILNVNQNINKVYNIKNIKFCYYYFVKIAI